MSLIPYKPFLDFDELFSNMKFPHTKSTGGLLSPKIDVSEKDNNFLIEAEFPGISSDDIHVTLEDGLLTLSAETQTEENREEKGKVIYQERQYGKYSRSFNVGKTIQESDITANFKDGVLSLTLPKVGEKEQGARRIPISS